MIVYFLQSCKSFPFEQGKLWKFLTPKICLHKLSTFLSLKDKSRHHLFYLFNGRCIVYISYKATALAQYPFATFPNVLALNLHHFTATFSCLLGEHKLYLKDLRALSYPKLVTSVPYGSLSSSTIPALKLGEIQDLDLTPYLGWFG